MYFTRKLGAIELTSKWHRHKWQAKAIFDILHNFTYLYLRYISQYTYFIIDLFTHVPLSFIRTSSQSCTGCNLNLQVNKHSETRILVLGPETVQQTSVTYCSLQILHIIMYPQRKSVIIYITSGVQREV